MVDASWALLSVGYADFDCALSSGIAADGRGRKAGLRERELEPYDEWECTDVARWGA